MAFLNGGNAVGAEETSEIRILQESAAHVDESSPDCVRSIFIASLLRHLRQATCYWALECVRKLNDVHL